MATTHARLETQQAQRLMTRLGRHWGHKFDVVMEDGRLVVPFSETERATLVASASGLDIEVVHPEQEGVEKLKDVVAEHLQRFSKDEVLKFVWS
ncbi:MAG: DUF2218 domain-containing protein [Alcanivorax sp.]|nr:DUF2218 domain-containing protein [Alcanivorax sp.]